MEDHEVDWFNIEDMWKHYLSKLNVKESDWIPIQVKETKQAFYAGIGELLFSLKYKIPELSEDKAVEQFEDYTNQVKTHFNKLVNG